MSDLKQIIAQAIQAKSTNEASYSSILIVAVTQIEEIYAPIVNSLKEANEQNTNLLQDKLKLENDILAYKNTIAAYSEKNDEDLHKEIINTCEKGKYFYTCDFWETSHFGCKDCKFFKGTDKYVDGQTK